MIKILSCKRQISQSQNVFIRRINIYFSDERQFYKLNNLNK